MSIFESIINDIKENGNKDKQLVNFEKNGHLFDNFENKDEDEGDEEFSDSDYDENYNEDDIEEGNNEELNDQRFQDPEELLYNSVGNSQSFNSTSKPLHPKVIHETQT